MLRNLTAVFALAFSFLLAALAAEPVSTGFWSSTAIGGQDTVSYHVDAKRKAHQVAAGDKRFEVQYLGANWRFASKESADRFAANPAGFVPRYNGHCANALSTGEGLVSTDGTVWDFFGDTLYLFYAEAGRQRWLKGDWQAYKTQADLAWNALVKK